MTGAKIRLWCCVTLFRAVVAVRATCVLRKTKKSLDEAWKE